MEIVTGLKSANFLNLTLNLNTATYKPYKKPNDTLLYVHTSSNYPQQILQQLPKAIYSFSKNSSTEVIFKKATKEYKEALKKTLTMGILNGCLTKTIYEGGLHPKHCIYHKIAQHYNLHNPSNRNGLLQLSEQTGISTRWNCETLPNKV